MRYKRAFTLLELILVVAITLSLVALSTPLFRRTYEGLALSSASKNIAYMARFCREKAVFERRGYRLVIDADKKLCRILAEDEEDNSFKPLRQRWGKPFRIPSGVEIESEKKELSFSPSGRADSAVIYLSNKVKDRIIVSIEENSGRVRIYDYAEE